MPTTKWPDLRTTDPISASEHLAALQSDFNTLRTFSSSTGKDRRIPTDLFRRLHDSYTALNQKLAGAISRQLGPQTEAAGAVLNKDIPQHASEGTALNNLDWLESTLDDSVLTFGVVMEGVRVDRLNLRPRTRNYMATQMLAAANASALPSLVNQKDLLSVQYRNSKKRGVANLEIEFATPEQGNEAILRGLKWEEKKHRCTRLVRDSEVQTCKNCQRFGHTLSECTNETACKQCFGPHPSTNCGRRPQTCNYCGKMHTPGSVCSSYSAERRKAKAVVQFQQPLWPVTEDANPIHPLALGSRPSIAHSLPIPRPSQRAPPRDSDQIGHHANVRSSPTYGTAELAGAAVASPRAPPIQVAGSSRASVADTQHSGQGPETKKYEAVLRELEHLKRLVNNQKPNSPPSIQSPARAPALTQSQKRRATGTLNTSNAEEPRLYGKRIKFTQNPTPPRVMEELEDPMETYTRETGSTTVEAGEGLRNALERAGIVDEPAPRAQPWRRHRRSPDVQNSWYSWGTHQRQQPNANSGAPQQPRNPDHGGDRSMTDQCGRGMPANHQLPYSNHYGDRYRPRYAASEWNVASIYGTYLSRRAFHPIDSPTFPHTSRKNIISGSLGMYPSTSTPWPDNSPGQGSLGFPTLIVPA